MKIPGLCLALLLLALPVLGADRGVFFEVRGPQGSVWLLGSLHAATADFYPLNPAINAAFHSAQKLVVEVDMDRIDPQTLQQWLQANALYPAGHSLRNALSPATATALDQACLRDRLPCEQLMKQRPGLFVMSLVSTRMAQLGYDPQLGIDQHFVQRARDTKPIVDLEDWRDQLGLLLEFSDADLLVQQLLEQLDDADDFLRDTSAAWRAGNLERLNQ
ncbi:MAG TPA: TraB/GumN family protein, partial [Spongiibacteraceae bacterium]|nr:TraB/GumN family protein [Spongiibacteraceae bacterium]